MQYSNVLRFLSPPWLASRLYVIYGELYPQYKNNFSAPAPSADPRYHKLPMGGITDAEFQEKYQKTTMVFRSRKQAIEYGRCCDLKDVSCAVYDRVFGNWIKNPQAEDLLISEIM